MALRDEIKSEDTPKISKHPHICLSTSSILLEVGIDIL